MATKNLDVFSPYSDVLQFFVNKMLQPTRQEQIFYFEKLNAYYSVTVQPIEALERRLMVTMIDVTAYKVTMRAHNLTSLLMFLTTSKHHLQRFLVSPIFWLMTLTNYHQSR